MLEQEIALVEPEFSKYHPQRHYYLQHFQRWTLLIPVANAVKMLPGRVVPNVATKLAKIALFRSRSRLTIARDKLGY